MCRFSAASLTTFRKRSSPRDSWRSRYPAFTFSYGRTRNMLWLGLGRLGSIQLSRPSSAHWKSSSVCVRIGTFVCLGVWLGLLCRCPPGTPACTRQTGLAIALTTLGSHGTHTFREIKYKRGWPFVEQRGGTFPMTM